MNWQLKSVILSTRVNSFTWTVAECFRIYDIDTAGTIGPSFSQRNSFYLVMARTEMLAKKKVLIDIKWIFETFG